MITREDLLRNLHQELQRDDRFEFRSILTFGSFPKLTGKTIVGAVDQELAPHRLAAAPHSRMGALDRTTRQGAKWLRKPRGQAHPMQVAGVDLSIVLLPQRFQAFAMNPGAFCNPLVWKEGAAILPRHKAHLLISEEGVSGQRSAENAYDRAAAVMAATAAVAGISKPTGVVWHPAMNALSIKAFYDSYVNTIENRAALEFWTRWYLIEPQTGQQPGIATQGLLALLGREIEAPPSNVPMEEMLTNVFRLASYLIDHDAVVLDGDTVGEGAERIRVRHRDLGQRPGVPIYEIVPETRGAPN